MLNEYPIYLSIQSELSRRRSYDPVQLRAWKKSIEDYVNDRAKDLPETVINYGDIEIALGISKKVIRIFLESVGGGYNGITIYNKKSYGV